MMNHITKILYKPYDVIFIPLYHSILELLHLALEYLKPLVKFVTLFALLLALVSSLGHYQLALWCLKWIGLGIMSSIGFGFGMHTFVLFLAPHIAAVTLASQSCKTLDFPQPPYPNEIICPGTYDSTVEVTFLNILMKVFLEAFMWGLGTAIGELPPYLGARLRVQSRKSSPKISGDHTDETETAANWEQWMIKIIRKIGFIGILLCAAIPNPLFDAAGVASGTAQVPFIVFFGATFIGKAIIKMLIQTSFVIVIFHNNYLDSLILRIDERLSEFSSSLGDLNLHGLISQFLDQQREKVLRKQLNEPRQTSMITTLFNSVTGAMMLLFVIALINSLDKQYRDRTTPKPKRWTK